MDIFAGLDVSDKTTHVCVVDGAGGVIRREVVASDPDILAKWLAKHCPGLMRVTNSGDTILISAQPPSTFVLRRLSLLPPYAPYSDSYLELRPRICAEEE